MGIGSFIVAALLILSGTAMLMINQGYGSWSMLQQAGQYWPVILILMGMGMILGNRLPKWLAYVLLALCLAGVLWLFYQAGHLSTAPYFPPVG